MTDVHPPKSLKITDKLFNLNPLLGIEIRLYVVTKNAHFALKNANSALTVKIEVILYVFEK